MALDGVKIEGVALSDGRRNGCSGGGCDIRCVVSAGRVAAGDECAGAGGGQEGAAVPQEGANLVV